MGVASFGMQGVRQASFVGSLVDGWSVGFTSSAARPTGCSFISPGLLTIS